MNVLLRLATLLSGLFGSFAMAVGIYAFFTLYKNTVLAAMRASLVGTFALLTALTFVWHLRNLSDADDDTKLGRMLPITVIAFVIALVAIMAVAENSPDFRNFLARLDIAYELDDGH